MIGSYPSNVVSYSSIVVWIVIGQYPFGSESKDILETNGYISGRGGTAMWTTDLLI